MGMLDGKNVVVTGGNRGIGKAIVSKCAENGANVWVCARNDSDELREYIAELTDKYGVKIVFIQLDLNDEESIKEAGKKIRALKTTIDAVVNNAGIVGENRLFSMTTMEELKRVFEVNFFGPMQFTQNLVKAMMKQRSGAIINISSDAAIDGRPSPFAYVSSKSAIIGATKKLAFELGNYGIRVNAVAPGVTNTEMIDAMSEDIKGQVLQNSALKRFGEPDEIADVIVFLISDYSRYMTGQVICVDGGGN